MYRWIIAIDVAPDTVADGLDLTNPDVLTDALTRAFPYSRITDWHVQVLLSPEPDAVAREQGYTDDAERKARDNDNQT